MDRILPENRWPVSIFIALAFALPVPAQDGHLHTGSPRDHHRRHSEISAGTGLVWLPSESEWGYGIHLHAIVGITEWMGAGAGFEMILGQHLHRTVTALAHFHPFHPLDINVGPGLVLPDEEERTYRFRMHAEVATVFELGKHLHLGPSVDTGFGGGDAHVTLGIHAGWIFTFRKGH